MKMTRAELRDLVAAHEGRVLVMTFARRWQESFLETTKEMLLQMLDRENDNNVLWFHVSVKEGTVYISENRDVPQQGEIPEEARR